MAIKSFKSNLADFSLIAAGAMLLLSTTVFAEGGTGGGGHGGVVWQCGMSQVESTYLADVALLEMAHLNA